VGRPEAGAVPRAGSLRGDRPGREQRPGQDGGDTFHFSSSWVRRNSTKLCRADSRRKTMSMRRSAALRLLALMLSGGGIMLIPATSRGTAADDEKAVAALDTEYQAAVERNDAETMAKILAGDMVLVVGKGTVYTREDLLKSARDKDAIYEKQVE